MKVSKAFFAKAVAGVCASLGLAAPVAAATYDWAGAVTCTGQTAKVNVRVEPHSEKDFPFNVVSDGTKDGTYWDTAEGVRSRDTNTSIMNEIVDWSNDACRMGVVPAQAGTIYRPLASTVSPNP